MQLGREELEKRVCAIWLFCRTSILEDPVDKYVWSCIHEEFLGKEHGPPMIDPDVWEGHIKEWKGANVIMHGRDYRWDVHIAKLWEEIHEGE